jgi:hypothetical protein
MYLYRFEQIVRTFLPAGAHPATWALPYWDYSSGAPSDALPPAFRTQKLPDGTANPLFVAARRAAVMKGNSLPAFVTDTSQAMAETVFTRSGFGGLTGFGGPRTGFAHQGPAFGELEAQPHGQVHVWVGGPGGLMTDPNTAALDPIFWLHHSNIDRLWSAWLSDGNSNPTSASWTSRQFALRDAQGASATMQVTDVLDSVTQLGYTYADQPAVAAASEGRRPVPDPGQPVMVGASEQPLDIDRRGGEVDIAIHGLTDSAAAGVDEQRIYLNLADIEGEANHGIVYGVFINLPENASEKVRAAHLAGAVPFFGIELTTPQGAAASGEAAHAMRYSFDITRLVDRLRAQGDWDPERLRVQVLPLGDEPESAALALPPPIRVGTFSIYQG